MEIALVVIVDFSKNSINDISKVWCDFLSSRTCSFGKCSALVVAIVVVVVVVVVVVEVEFVVVVVVV